jgi:phosphopentomutase
MEVTIDICKTKSFTGLCFINLVDFDSVYGHRRNPVGYKEAFERFDSLLNEMIKELKQDDLVIITADHGNDPTWKGTDHTREYVPLIVHSKTTKGGSLGTRKSFADIGAAIASNFEIQMPKIGKSFLKEIK